MRVEFWLCASLGLANASALRPRDSPEDGYVSEPLYPTKDDSTGYKADDDTGYEIDPPKDDYYKVDPPKVYKPVDPPKEYKPIEPPKDYKPVEPPKDYKPVEPPKDYKPVDPPKEYKPVDPPKDSYPTDKPEVSWKPKTHHPEFFSLKVDDQCTGEETAEDCPFSGYAIRLEKGIVIATPYNKWWDPKLPIFFVDDDTQAYTVSKKPLQLYVETVTGALRYAPVGWLPPNSIAFSFYKTGNNPLGKVDPSPAYFAWPTTEGRASALGAGVWWFCPLSGTGQYQVFISDANFGDSKQGGVWKDPFECKKESLAAINANPWKKSGV